MLPTVNKNLLTEVTIRVVLWLLFLWLQYSEPFIRIIKPEESWLYTYPLTPSYISSQFIWTMITLVPGLAFTIEYLYRRNKKDLIEGILCITLIYTLNGFLTAYLKVIVGRPRPDFYARCIPEGLKDGHINCLGDKFSVMDGRKSFPSGHSSFSFSCMTFLTLYATGKLKLLNQNKKVESWKLMLCLMPLIAATTIAISRTCDYHHHWQDVTAGSLLGFVIAYICYYLYFPPLSSNNSHQSYMAQNLGIDN